MVGEIEIANAAKLKELDLVRELLKNSGGKCTNCNSVGLFGIFKKLSQEQKHGWIITKLMMAN